MGYLNMYLIAFFEERLSFHLRRKLHHVCQRNIRFYLASCGAQMKSISFRQCK